jgi:hypothetical protein
MEKQIGSNLHFRVVVSSIKKLALSDLITTVILAQILLTLILVGAFS